MRLHPAVIGIRAIHSRVYSVHEFQVVEDGGMLPFHLVAMVKRADKGSR